MVPTLSIQPADALIDVPRGIRVERRARPDRRDHRAHPPQRRAVAKPRRLRRGRGRQRGPDARRAARLGDYAGVSPMGLIWSQSPWTRPAASPSTIRHRAAGHRGPGARRRQVQGKFTQRLAAEGVTRQDVREHGLGTLYLPPAPRPARIPPC